MDSDEELQEAFAAGLLKPGLHRAVPESGAKKVFANNVDGLKQKLAELQAPVKSFNWIERLDHVVLKSAPLAPELALKEADLSKKADAGSDVHNDFQREMTFYRQAQATVLEVLPRLQSMGVPTKRPQDYYAQMAKTDDHMQKIREKLVSKQLADERLEKVKKLREMKKFGRSRFSKRGRKKRRTCWIKSKSSGRVRLTASISWTARKASAVVVVGTKITRKVVQAQIRPKDGSSKTKSLALAGRRKE